MQRLQDVELASKIVQFFWLQIGTSVLVIFWFIAFEGSWTWELYVSKQCHKSIYF